MDEGTPFALFQTIMEGSVLRDRSSGARQELGTMARQIETAEEEAKAQRLGREEQRLERELQAVRRAKQACDDKRRVMQRSSGGGGGGNKSAP